MKKSNILKVVISFLFIFFISTNLYAKTTLKGDIDGDGKVTSYDAYLCLEISQESNEEVTKTLSDEEINDAVDVNEDEKIDDTDTNLILNYSAGNVAEEIDWEVNDESESINRYYYNQLDDYEKSIYDEIIDNPEKITKDRSIYNMGTELNDVVNGKTDKDINTTLQNTYNAIHYDNPELFYLYALGGNNAVLLTKDGCKQAFIVKTLLTDEAKNMNIENAIMQFEQIKNDVINCTYGMNDYDKLLFLHNYIVQNTDYSSNSSNKYNAYGCLVGKNAVCEGYALAYKYLCNSAGIRCEIIVSQTHAWNAVYLDGSWYYVDTTWDESGENGLSQQFFLRGSDYMNNVSCHEPCNVGSFVYPVISKKDYIY